MMFQYALRGIRQICLCGVIAASLTLVSGVPAEVSKTAPSDPATSTRDGSEEDAHYTRVLKVYRGELSREEVALITEVDPAPVLFLGPNVELRNLARMFGSLPDSTHAQLRRTGFVKWKLETLPGDQRRWVSDLARRFTESGEGPYKSSVTTGFIAVPSKGEEGPIYSWWIDAEKASRPVWIPLIRARGFGGEAQFQSHLQTLLAHRKTPVSAAVPSREWLKIPLLARIDVEAVAEDEAATEFAREYAQLVQAYQGKLKKEQLLKLTADDPLLSRRLRSADSHERAVNSFFARLTEPEHQKLREVGRIQWTSGQLSAAQKRMLAPVVAEMNRRATEGGNEAPAYSLEGPVGCMVGFTFVEVPMVKKLVLSWWIRSLTAPIPAWFSLNNDSAVKAPGYYEAHLSQLVR